MFQDEELKAEQPAIVQLRVKLGWTYVPGASLAPVAVGKDAQSSAERGTYRDVVLVQRLESALRKLNPWISNENLGKVMRELTHPNHAALMDYNHSIYEMLVNYLSVGQT